MREVNDGERSNCVAALDPVHAHLGDALGTRSPLPHVEPMRATLAMSIDFALNRHCVPVLCKARNTARRFEEERMASTTDPIACVRLTAREHEVFQRILRRETIKDIAQGIGTSPKTAEFHVRNVLWKLRLSSRKQVVERTWVLSDLGIIDVDALPRTR